MSLLLTTLLIGVLPPALFRDDPAAEAYKKLVAAYEVEHEAWLVKYDGLDRNTPEVMWEIRDREWPGWTYIPRFLELAEDDPDTRDAVFWVVERGFAVNVGDRRFLPHLRRVLALLSGPNFHEEERLATASSGALAYPAPWTEAFLREILARAESRELRAHASLGLGRLLMSRAKVAESPWFDNPRLPY